MHDLHAFLQDTTGAITTTLSLKLWERIVELGALIHGQAVSVSLSMQFSRRPVSTERTSFRVRAARM